MSDTLVIRTKYSGSEHTRDEVKQQLLERFGHELAEQYDPYTNCMTLHQWQEFGYRVKPGEKSIKSIVMIEKRDEHDEVISMFPRTVHLFYFPQVKKVRYGN